MAPIICGSRSNPDGCNMRRFGEITLASNNAGIGVENSGGHTTGMWCSRGSFEGRKDIWLDVSEVDDELESESSYGFQESVVPGGVGG